MSGNRLFLSVADAYDRWSAFYDRYDNPMVYMATEIVERSIPDLAGKAVLEFGCGTGRNLAALARKGAGPIAGCDLSAGMLAVASQRAAGCGLFLHDITRPAPLVDDAVDVVLFCLALEHIADLEMPLREARRILRPGGRIHVIEIHPFLSLGGSAAHYDDGEIEVRMPTFPHQFEDYLNTFARLGLEVARCREWKPTDVGNPKALQSPKRAASVPLTVEFSVKRP